MADFKAAFDDSFHRDVAKHVRHRNALLPIATLPVEILQMIFNIVLFSPRGRRKDRFVWRLTTLRGVSWSWRDLIGRTPSFWAHLSSEDHTDFISEALERSSQTPIHLKHIGKFRDGPDVLFLDKVLPHVHRWEFVAIHQPNLNVAGKYFSISAPNIKTLLLSSLGNGTYEAGAVGSLFGADLANLEVLRVDFCGLDWRGVCCTRLRILDIERELSCDMGAILHILASNPRLEILRLHDITFHRDSQPDSIPAPIPLDHLTQLTLIHVEQGTEDSFSVSHPAVATLLQRIRFRIGIPFTIMTRLEGGSPLTPKAFINLIPNPAESLTHLSLVEGFQRAQVDVKFQGENFLFRIRDASRSKPVFSAEVNGLPPQVAKEWVLESVRQASGTPVDLRLYFGSDENDEYDYQSSFPLEDVSYFQLWESVVDLTLEGNPAAPPYIAQDIQRLLSTPCMSEDGVMVMPFPKLRHLRIYYISDIKTKHLLAMVQVRFASPGSTEAEAASHSAGPAPLTIHCGNGLEALANSPLDKILDVPGVEGVIIDLSPPISRSSSPISSESDWPPPGGFFDAIPIDALASPISAEGSLEVMDLRLQCMTDFKTFFDDAVRRKVVKHVRHRNALLPIGTLPTELLQDIFNLLLFTAEGSRKRRCGLAGWRELSCTRLRVLEIEGESSLDMGVVLDILAANPNFEVIRLHSLKFVQYVQPQPNPPPLLLKNLKELTLKDITHITADWYSGPDVPIAHLLQRIQLRPSIAFTLKTELPSQSLVKPEKFISLLPSPVEALTYLSRLDDSQSAKVKAKFAGKSISLKIQENSRSKPVFFVELDGLPEPLAKNWVVGALGETTAPMDLRLHFANVGEQPILSLDEIFHFKRWESVKGLFVDGNFRNPPDFSRTFMQLFSTRCTPETGIPVMPFPKLQNIYLSGLSGIKAKAMLDMVRMRFAPPASPEATADGAVPVPFTIHFGNGVGGWNNKHMDDILDTSGVQGVEYYMDAASSLSSTSSEPEWPPLYSYGDDIGDIWEGDDFIEDSEAEVSEHGSDGEMSFHELVADESPHESDAEMSLHELYAEEGVDDI
ncbi:hypothetical protein FRC00_000845 [Tulasnella sp. 408]|nr:hypothetical protein FRC00_000845 [Tulasnella sp. 408]